MKITILVTLLLVGTFSQSCNRGGLPCNQGQCHYPSYIEGCFKYAPDNSCAECQYSTHHFTPDYQLASGACLYSPISAGKDCCLQFDTATSTCKSCSKGLTINTKTGLCEDRKIEGCILKNNNGCSVCSLNYDLVGNLCAKRIQGCTSYDQNLACIACSSAFSFFQGSCIPAVQINPITNCKYTTEYGCVECNAGFRINKDGTCTLPAIVGCLVMNVDGSCGVCESPYYILQGGQCRIVGCLQSNGAACTQCDSSLGFTLINNRCEIANCLYFGPSGCTRCVTGFAAGTWGCKSSSEKVCLICKADEFLGVDGQCYKKDIHCTKYQNGVCQSCIDGFFLDSNRKCQKRLFGCTYINGVCSSCVAPFTFQSGSCVITGCTQYSAQGCAVCDPRLVLVNGVCTIPNCKQISGFTCAVCSDGFQLDTSSKCVAVDPNCEVRNALNVCLKCKESFMFSKDGRCISMKLGCNYVDGRCTSCRSPFIYVPSTESCLIDGCLQYFVGGCSQCDKSYALLYNSCKLPNCLISSNGKCLECDPDYLFTSNGICVSKDEFCDKMDEYGTCIKCMSNYYYSKTEKKCIRNRPGCNYDLDGICVSCNAPFEFKNNQCVIFGCSSLSDFGCAECSYPFKLNSKSLCEIPNCNAYNNGKCVGCNQGFALTSNNLCLAQDPNCLTYNIQQTACERCKKGYRFDEKRRCEYADEHCWQFDESGICMNCDRLYFLNPYGKCQLRDPQCKVYSNGFCSECKQYYFSNNGVCFANLKGCKVQKNYKLCLTCDSGYSLNNGVCDVDITVLNWNSVNMDFFDDDTQEKSDQSKSVFNVKFTDSTNLVQAIAAGSAQVFYSSSSINGAQFQVDSAGANGWSPVGKPEGSFIGIKTSDIQTFYAIDVRSLTGSTLTSFSLEYSYDGKLFNKAGQFSLVGTMIGSVKTIYFNPVQAQFIRLVTRQGLPHIKIEFYYSSISKLPQEASDSTSTFISKTVASSIQGAQGGISACQDNALCWAGVQSCEPRKLLGFSLIYTEGSSGAIQNIKIDYSMDGITFTCWDSCKEITLKNNSYVFPSPLLAEKVHIHFTKYTGNPKFGIKFDWAQ